LESEGRSVIAVCGLVCGECDIHEAANDPELVQEIADWLSDKMGRETDLGSIRCEGCRGPGRGIGLPTAGY
jgi:hypothetical protein